MKNKVNVLLVDDSKIILDYVRLMFRDVEYIGRMEIATCVAQAQDIIRNEETDLVILDISLPDGNGIDMLKWIKYLYPKTIVIMFSNCSDQVHRMISKEYGAEYFFDKVTEFDKLPGAVLEFSENKINAG